MKVSDSCCVLVHKEAVCSLTPSGRNEVPCLLCVSSRMLEEEGLIFKHI